MGTTKPKFTIIHKDKNKKENQSIPLWKIINQLTEERSKKWKMEVRNNQKRINNMALISPYLPIITHSINGLISLMKKHNGLKKKKDLYAAYKSLTLA